MSGSAWRLALTRDRLLSRVNKLPSGCWEWTRFVNRQGYGMTSYRGRRGTLAHRAFYMEMIGQIPDDMTIDHMCHNRDLSCPGGSACRHRRCVNPEHLEPATGEDNSRRAGHARKTHCPKGHEYSAGNTRVIGGRRFCIRCQQEKDAARKGSRH